MQTGRTIRTEPALGCTVESGRGSRTRATADFRGANLAPARTFTDLEAAGRLSDSFGHPTGSGWVPNPTRRRRNLTSGLQNDQSVRSMHLEPQCMPRVPARPPSPLPRRPAAPVGRDRSLSPEEILARSPTARPARPIIVARRPDQRDGATDAVDPAFAAAVWRGASPSSVAPGRSVRRQGLYTAGSVVVGRVSIGRLPVAASNRARKALSLVMPYKPMEQGRVLLDRQYLADEWSYLRSIEEAPRFGIVSAYCRALATGGSILEIGCGEGVLLEQLDRTRFGRFTGVDISSVAITRAQSLADECADFACADAERYIPHQAYELIVFNEVLEYFDDPLRLVQRYDEHVTPGGHFVVSMFAGVDTARTRRIWRRLDDRYEAAASSRVTTMRDHTWIIKAYKVHNSR